MARKVLDTKIQRAYNATVDGKAFHSCERTVNNIFVYMIFLVYIVHKAITLCLIHSGPKTEFVYASALGFLWKE